MVWLPGNQLGGHRRCAPVCRLRPGLAVTDDSDMVDRLAARRRGQRYRQRALATGAAGGDVVPPKCGKLNILVRDRSASLFRSRLDDDNGRLSAEQGGTAISSASWSMLLSTAIRLPRNGFWR